MLFIYNCSWTTDFFSSMEWDSSFERPSSHNHGLHLDRTAVYNIHQGVTMGLFDCDDIRWCGPFHSAVSGNQEKKWRRGLFTFRVPRPSHCQYFENSILVRYDFFNRINANVACRILLPLLFAFYRYCSCRTEGHPLWRFPNFPQIGIPLSRIWRRDLLIIFL